MIEIGIIAFIIIGFFAFYYSYGVIGLITAKRKNKKIFEKKTLPKTNKFIKMLRENGIHCIPIHGRSPGAITFNYLIPFRTCFVFKETGLMSNNIQEFMAYHELFHFYPKRFGFSRIDRYNEALASIVAKKEFLKHHTKEEYEQTMREGLLNATISGAITAKELIEKDFSEVYAK